jgi:hypothetical protein
MGSLDLVIPRPPVFRLRLPAAEAPAPEAPAVEAPAASAAEAPPTQA